MSSALYFANPGAQTASHRREIAAAIEQVLDSGVYIQGKFCAAFEQAFSDYLGGVQAIGVANGTDALVLALTAGGISAGDHVLAPSHTAPPTISAIRQIGAIPVFVDIDPQTYVVTADLVAAALTPQTKAIIAVHLYGYPADVEALRALADARGLLLIEDCAQAAGAKFGDRRVGTIGHLGCFSFFPTKNLGGIGDGGAVVTSDPDLAEQLRRMRNYGWNAQRICIEDGFNSRLDEMQAAILNVKLATLDADNDRRRALAAAYRAGLAGLPVTLPADGFGRRHVYHLFVIACDMRDALKVHLATEGIFAGIHYELPTHRHPAFQPFHVQNLPETERAVGRILTLPIYPELSLDDVTRVCASIHRFFG